MTPGHESLAYGNELQNWKLNGLDQNSLSDQREKNHHRKRVDQILTIFLVWRDGISCNYFHILSCTVQPLETSPRTDLSLPTKYEML